MLQLVLRDGGVYQAGKEMKEFSGRGNNKSKENNVGEKTVHLGAAGSLVKPQQRTGRARG